MSKIETKVETKVKTKGEIKDQSQIQEIIRFDYKQYVKETKMLIAMKFQILYAF